MHTPSAVIVNHFIDITLNVTTADNKCQIFDHAFQDTNKFLS